jgi:N-acetylneuraminic acid mutarotase
MSYSWKRLSTDGITPEGEIKITTTESVDVTNYASAKVVDSNLVPENIAKDISILGIVGTFEGGITPTGELAITENGTYDVTNYASANVNVASSGGSGGEVKFIHTLECIETKLPSSQTQFMGSASVGDNIYLFGGQNNTTSTMRISSILKFNTITEELTTLSTTLPDRVMNIRCCAIGTKIYLFGGSFYSSSVMEYKIYIFDTETETLSLSNAVMPTQLTSYFVAFPIDTKVYVHSSSNKALYVYDTIADTITTISVDITSNYSDKMPFVDDNKIYLFGGYKISSSSLTNDYDVYCYDIETGTLETFTKKWELPIFSGVSNRHLVIDENMNNYCYGYNYNKSIIIKPHGKDGVFTLSLDKDISIIKNGSSLVYCNGYLYIFGGYASESGSVASKDIFKLKL